MSDPRRSRGADPASETVHRAVVRGAREGKSPKDAVHLDRLAYSIKNLATAIDLSDETLRKAIIAGELVPSYAGSKPLILREEAERWLRSLPAERSSKAVSE